MTTPAEERAFSALRHTDPEDPGRPFTSYAAAYCQLLGDGWRRDGWTVINDSNAVRIDARLNTVTWLDLSPDDTDELRTMCTVQLPGASSIGAITAIAKALAELASEDS